MSEKNGSIAFNLVHDGCKWIAASTDIKVSGNSLAELDRLIKKAITDSGRFSKGSRIKVDLLFDFNSIPGWIRQYSPYYFNRHLEIEV